jgi:hypothetical protein
VCPDVCGAILGWNIGAFYGTVTGKESKYQPAAGEMHDPLGVGNLLPDGSWHDFRGRPHDYTVLTITDIVVIHGSAMSALSKEKLRVVLSGAPTKTDGEPQVGPLDDTTIRITENLRILVFGIWQDQLVAADGTAIPGWVVSNDLVYVPDGTYIGIVASGGSADGTSTHPILRVGECSEEASTWATAEAISTVVAAETDSGELACPKPAIEAYPCPSGDVPEACVRQ